MAACESCGAALQPGADVCDLCGAPAGARADDAPVEAAAAVSGASSASPAICPQCGAVPPPGSAYCNVCGAALPASGPVEAPAVEAPASRTRPPSDAGKKGLVVVGVGLLAVVALYALTLLSPRPAPDPEPAPADPAVGEAAPIPPGAPPLPDSLQTAADAFAAEGTASGWYESGRYYLTAAFNAVESDPTSSVRWARRAIEDFEQSLEIADDPRVRVALAEAATFDPSNPMRPVQELRAVLEADPDNVDATFLLADRRLMIGRVDSARAGFERVIELAPPGSVARQRAEDRLAEIAGG